MSIGRIALGSGLKMRRRTCAERKEPGVSMVPCKLPLRIGYEIIFDAPAATPMVLMLRVHPGLEHQLREPEVIHIEPTVAITEFIDGFGNRAARIMAPPGALRIWSVSV